MPAPHETHPNSPDSNGFFDNVSQLLLRGYVLTGEDLAEVAIGNGYGHKSAVNAAWQKMSSLTGARKLGERGIVLKKEDYNGRGLYWHGGLDPDELLGLEEARAKIDQDLLAARDKRRQTMASVLSHVPNGPKAPNS